MNKFVFHGAIGKQYGREFTLSVNTIAEGLRAIAMQVPGFSDKLSQGYYKVLRGSLKDGEFIEEETLGLRRNNQEIHFVPQAVGRSPRSKGGAKLIAGIALVAAAVFIPGGATLAASLSSQVLGGLGVGLTYGTVGLFGLSLALGGIAMMVAPSPKLGDPNDAEDRAASFVFNGPVNLTEQGHAIPIVYGRMRVGSIVVAAAYEIESIFVGGGVYDGVGGYATAFTGGLDASVIGTGDSLYYTVGNTAGGTIFTTYPDFDEPPFPVNRRDG